MIIVGAGPAGSTAARLLAERGHKVHLFDAQRFPRIKPCGGAVTARALSLLPAGYQSQLLGHPDAWTFQGRNLPPVTVRRTRPYCHIVERQHFDSWLVDRAIAAGARFSDGRTVDAIAETRDGVVVHAGSDTCQARYLVAADGAKGISARTLPIPRLRPGAAIEVEVPVSEPIYALWHQRVEIDVSHYPWGYAWVIPRYPVLNIGVGSFRAATLPLKNLFAAYVTSKLGSGLPADAPARAHPLPFRTHLPRLHTSRTLFVGDAAGLMDAFSAEGIFSALWSARLAAEVLHGTLAEDRDGLPAYSSRVRNEMWPNLAPALKMARLFYPLSGFWSRFFVRNQSLLHDYLDVAEGRQTYRELLAHTERALLPRVTLHPSK
ncbi:MAG: geranylgeranyl reductase family protein [Thermaerobacter sp.]|nr:geranylgeranyl reductase family protein [Thermaerobacter sp.]